jgi:hypothetical protein
MGVVGAVTVWGGAGDGAGKPSARSFTIMMAATYSSETAD